MIARLCIRDNAGYSSVREPLRKILGLEAWICRPPSFRIHFPNSFTRRCMQLWKRRCEKQEWTAAGMNCDRNRIAAVQAICTVTSADNLSPSEVLHKILWQAAIVCRSVSNYMQLSPERILISCRCNGWYVQSLDGRRQLSGTSCQYIVDTGATALCRLCTAFCWQALLRSSAASSCYLCRGATVATQPLLTQHKWCWVEAGCRQQWPHWR